VNVYPFIEAEKQSKAAGGTGNVARACTLLKVSRSAYYQHAAVEAAGGSRREKDDQALLDRIRHHWAASKHRYGAPMIHVDLAAEGRHHSRKRIARIMRQNAITGRCPRRWRRTTIPDPAADQREDLIGRDFGVDATQINTRWCGDITYIRTWEGWAYLATVIDIGSRRVVGWAIADHMRTDLIENALRQAVARRRPPAGVIFHSDRGSQYTSAQFADAATELGVRLSHGRKGECWDNAVGESFFATYKRELTEDHAWPTRAGLARATFTYIESDYNIHRRHSTLGRLSPAAYEATAQLTGSGRVA